MAMLAASGPGDGLPPPAALSKKQAGYGDSSSAPTPVSGIQQVLRTSASRGSHGRRGAGGFDSPCGRVVSLKRWSFCHWPE